MEIDIVNINEDILPLSYRLQKYILREFDNKVTILKNTFYNEEEMKEQNQGYIIFKVDDEFYENGEEVLFKCCYEYLMDIINKIDKNMEMVHDFDKRIIKIHNLNKELIKLSRIQGD